MTIDTHVLILLISCSFLAFCSLVAAGFWYQQRTWTERFDDQQRNWAERFDYYQQPPLSVTQSRWHFFAGA
jgi:hypothetical protein